MSYDALTAILLAAAVVFLCFLSFRWGVRFGKDPAEAAERDWKPEFPHGKRKGNPKMEKMEKIMENVENYSGDGSNQRKI